MNKFRIEFSFFLGIAAILFSSGNALADASLSGSVSTLALSITGITEYGISGTPISGVAREFTITNTGSSAATGLSVEMGTTLPRGTTFTTTCSNQLNAGSSCTITLSPGSTASNNCTAGVTPTSSSITVTANNATPLNTNVFVLGYGCIYEGGYVFALDDSTPNTSSVGGWVVSQASSSLVPNGIVWDSSPGCMIDPFTACYTTSADSVTNGSYLPGGNTNSIYSALTLGHGEEVGTYAAGICRETIASYSDWYLPAICQMGYGAGDGTISCGNVSTPAMQNIQSSLIDHAGSDISSLLPGSVSGYYWSSTETSSAPGSYALYQLFSADSPGQGSSSKMNSFGVRCVRNLN